MGDVVITETGPLYTLEEVKAHLRVEVADDDVLIKTFMDSAQEAVLQYCNLSIVPYGKEAAFKVAAMLMVSDLYENRSGNVGLPPASKSIVNPYRWLRV